MKILVCLLAAVGVASADPAVRIEPKTVHPGDAVLVTVTGVADAPKGTAGGEALQFFRAKSGYQAVFAIDVAAAGDPVTVKVGDIEREVNITPIMLPESDVVVE